VNAKTNDGHTTTIRVLGSLGVMQIISECETSIRVISSWISSHFILFYN